MSVDENDRELLTVPCSIDREVCDNRERVLARRDGVIERKSKLACALPPRLRENLARNLTR
jgi:hypothetical protein